MPRWEYLKVQRSYDGKRRVETASRVNDQYVAQDPSQAPLLVDYLNQLGDEGWGLIQVSEERGVSYLKRSKS